MSRLKLFLLALFPFVIGMWISTYQFASAVQFDPLVIGESKLHIYAPWRWFSWYAIYHGHAGDLFMDSCMGLIVGVVFSLLLFAMFRPQKQLSSHGTARWANRDDLLKMDLISSHGCVIGLYDPPWKQGLTSVLRWLENQKKEKVSFAEMAFDKSVMRNIDRKEENLPKLRSRLSEIESSLRDSIILYKSLSDGADKSRLKHELDKKAQVRGKLKKKIEQDEAYIDMPPKYSPKDTLHDKVFIFPWVFAYKTYFSFYKHLSHFYLRDNSNKHLAVIAPTRSGKGVGLIVPTLLGGWNESVIVNDIKSENWGITAGYRKKMGQKVIKFEPTSDDGSTARWNPLDEIPLGDPMEVSMAQNLASVIADFEGKGKPDHWVANAGNVIMATILHLKYAHYSDPKKYPYPPNLYSVAAFLKVDTDSASNSDGYDDLRDKTNPNLRNSPPPDAPGNDDGAMDSADVNTLDSLDKEDEEETQESGTLTGSNESTPIPTGGNGSTGENQEEEDEDQEKTLDEDKPTGFVETIKKLLDFPHVGVVQYDENGNYMKDDKGNYVVTDGIEIDVWDTKSCKYVKKHFDSTMLKALYPDALSLNNPKYQFTHPIIMQAFAEISSKPDNELGSIVSTANTALKEYLDPILASNTSVSDFCIDDLMNYRKPVSLYLVTPPSDLLRLAPIFRLFFEMMVRHHARKIGTYQNGQAKTLYKHKCLFLMDEFSSLGNLQSFAATLSYIAGYGMKVFLINQGLPQINGIYGKDNQILMNCHIQIFYAPNDNDTGKYAESMLGNKTIIVESQSDSGNGGFFARKNISRSETGRALMTSDELKRMGDKEIIVASGFPPVFTDKIKYYENNFFTDKLMDAPYVSDVIRDDPVKNKNERRDRLIQLHKSGKLAKPSPKPKPAVTLSHKYVTYHDMMESNDNRLSHGGKGQ